MKVSMKAIELEKAFDPKGFEGRICRLWVECGAFAPVLGGGAPFVAALRGGAPSFFLLKGALR
ncbi:MAG: hypothetical protein LBS82_05725 [Spirochaetaceae bacterium]|nr:hypothetical protein [Spirochaetaceae bacterium]